MPRYNRANTPLLWVVVPLMLGIVYLQEQDPRYDSLFSGYLPSAYLVAGAAYIAIKRKFKEPIIWLSISVLGAILVILHRPAECAIPYGEQQQFIGTIDQVPTVKGRWLKSESTTTHILDSQQIWHPVHDRRTMLYIDTSQHITIGSTIRYKARCYPTDSSSYGRYMARRGITSHSFTWRVTSLGADTTAMQRIDILRRNASDRILIADSNDTHAIDSSTYSDRRNQTAGIMQALALGDKSLIDPELRRSYSRVGAAHILAVSGMHVGIIFCIINLIFGWLYLIRGGRIWMGVTVITLLGIYAVMTGLSPSVLRAVIMFSILQLGLMISRTTNSLNTLSAAAIVLLLVNPLYIYDISFQLSFAAMVGIVTIYGPMTRLWRPRLAPLRWLWNLSLVTLSAQLGSMPLAVVYFGQLPLAGLLLNPIIWFTVPLIIVGSLLYLATQWSWIGSATHSITSIQNQIVEWSSAHQWITIEGIELSPRGCLGIYILIFVCIVAINNYGTKNGRQRNNAHQF